MGSPRLYDPPNNLNRHTSFKKLENCYTKTMKKCLSGILFVLLLGITLYGTSKPWNKDLSIKIGSFTLKPYKYGIYLSPIQGVFYNFSPYDAYLKYKDETIEKLISSDSVVIAEEFTTQATIIKEKTDVIKSYFQLSFPVVTFMDEDSNIPIKTSVLGNKVSIWLENVPSRLRESSLVMTMSFNEYDYVFDSAGNIHYVKEEDLPLLLSKLPPNMALNSKEAQEVNRAINLLIMSKKHNSIVRIQDSLGVYKSIKVNKEGLLIEVELMSPDRKLVVEVFDSLEEAL